MRGEYFRPMICSASKVPGTEWIKEQVLGAPRLRSDRLSSLGAHLSFFSDYRRALDSMSSMLSLDAALLFTSYNQLIATRGISGPTLEIGVHHGASAIAIAALRKPGAAFVAIDLFQDLQDHNVSRSGLGDRDGGCPMVYADLQRRAADTARCDELIVASK